METLQICRNKAERALDVAFHTEMNTFIMFQYSILQQSVHYVRTTQQRCILTYSSECEPHLDVLNDVTHEVFTLATNTEISENVLMLKVF